MSPGFNEQQRDEIRSRLISAGEELASVSGFKGMTVAAVAKKAGIATGTFYNFFDSKESFAVALLQETEQRTYSGFARCFEDEKKIPLKKFIRLFRECFRPENNFLLRAGAEDWIWLKTHISGDQYFSRETELAKISAVLQHIDGVRSDIDLGTAVNFIKTIYAMYQNKDTFFEESLQTNVDLIFDALYRYMKG